VNCDEGVLPRRGLDLWGEKRKGVYRPLRKHYEGPGDRGRHKSSKRTGSEESIQLLCWNRASGDVYDKASKRKLSFKGMLLEPPHGSGS